MRTERKQPCMAASPTLSYSSCALDNICSISTFFSWATSNTVSLSDARRALDDALAPFSSSLRGTEATCTRLQAKQLDCSSVLGTVGWAMERACLLTLKNYRFSNSPRTWSWDFWRPLYNARIWLLQLLLCNNHHIIIMAVSCIHSQNKTCILCINISYVWTNCESVMVMMVLVNGCLANLITHDTFWQSA